MSSNTYDIGDTVRCQITFKNLSDIATDPTGVVFRYEAPSGTETTLTYGTDTAVVRSATGVYYVDLQPTTAGRWWYRFNGSGTIHTAEEGSFLVRRSRFVLS